MGLILGARGTVQRWRRGGHLCLDRGAAATGALRTRGILVAVTVCMAVLATSAMAAGTNLLSNGDFEGSGSGSLTGWKGQSATLALAAGDNGAGFGAQVTRTS